jgi:hypothetical protein
MDRLPTTSESGWQTEEPGKAGRVGQGSADSVGLAWTQVVRMALVKLFVSRLEPAIVCHQL